MSFTSFAPRVLAAFVAVALLFATMPAGREPVSAQVSFIPFSYMPSADVTDGRFVAQAGSGLFSLVDVGTEFELVVRPADLGEDGLWSLGIFDGDTGKNALGVVTNSFEQGHWDFLRGPLPLVPAQMEFNLFADPTGDVDTSSATPLCTWTGNSPVSACSDVTYTVNGLAASAMPDNEWFDIDLPSHAVALNDGGNASPEDDEFRYRIVSRLDFPIQQVESSFRLRISGMVKTIPGGVFQLHAPLRTRLDRTIIFPDWNPPTGNAIITSTNYDGTWSVFLELPAGENRLDIWEGDFDFGSRDGTTKDTDDPDSPAMPPFSATGSQVADEGVAVGFGNAVGMGNPPDDNVVAGSPVVQFVRAPSIVYDVIDPNGEVYSNLNPSGNQEWEKFTLATADSGCPVTSCADHIVPALPAGFYEIRISGMDLDNITALVLVQPAWITTLEGNANLGDTVWHDTNLNGIWDEGEEPGIPGVSLTVTRDINQNGIADNGEPMWSTTTGPNGQYLVTDLADGVYIVEVEAENFLPGGALDGLTQTTTDVSQDVDATNKVNPFFTGIMDGHLCASRDVEPVCDADNLTADFGYAGTASLGTTVFWDVNSSSFQDASEPGLGGVTVTVTLDSNSNGTADFGEPTWTRVTDADGNYDVSNLGNGQYIVQVDGASPSLGAFNAFSDGTHQSDAAADLIANDGWSKSSEVLPYVAHINDLTDNPIADFGYVIGGGASDFELGDTVFLDSNGNGTQDVGEPGIGDVDIEVHLDWDPDSDDPLAGDGSFDENEDIFLGTATIDANGKYVFPVPVDQVTYFVRVAASNSDVGSPLEGLLPTIDGPSVDDHPDVSSTAGPHDCRTSPYDVLIFGGNNYTADFGYLGTLGSIGDYIWYDADADGTQDGDEPGIGGVTVELWTDDNGNGIVDGTDALVNTDTTDGSGGYLFEGLGAGAYVVVIPSSQTTGAGPLATQTSSAPLSAAATTETDSNGITVAGGSVIGAVTIGAGEHNHSIDFGFYLGGTICLEGVDNPEQVSATIHYIVNTVAGTATVRTTLARSFADSAYGRPNSKSTGWPGDGRKFDQILTSDNLNLVLKNGNGTTVYDLTMDLLAYKSSNPVGSRYLTNGVLKTYSKSDGSIAVGSAANVLDVKTSISENLNNTWWTNYVNSPAVDVNYVGSGTPAGWIWDTWYEATVRLAPFGASGFGTALVPALHSSPSKTGGETPVLRLCPDGTVLECEACDKGVAQATFKVSSWSSSRDQNEQIRVRENGLSRAVLFDSMNDGVAGNGIPNNGSFTVNLPHPGTNSLSR